MLALLLEKGILFRSQSYVNTKKIESVLKTKQIKLDNKISEVQQIIQESDPRNLFQSNPGLWENLAVNEGLVIMVYHNNILEFWSDHSPPLTNLFSDNDLRKKIIKLDNAWYICRNVSFKDYNIVGLIRLKNNYSYENDYLKNRFQKHFKINPAVRVSADSIITDHKIYGKDGEFVFSLLLDQNIEIKGNLKYFSAIFYFIALLFLLLYMQVLYNFGRKRWPGNIWLIALLADLILIRFLMIQFRFPGGFYELEIFEENNYSGFFFSSPGDFLLSSLFILIFTYNIFRGLNISKLSKPVSYAPKNNFTGIVSLFCLNLFFIFVLFLNNSLITKMNTLLEVYKILNLNILIVLGLLNIGILIGAFLLIADRTIKISVNRLPGNRMPVFFLISFMISYLVAYLLKVQPDSISICLLFVLVLIIGYLHTAKKIYTYSVLVLSLFVISVYTTLYITDHNNNKEKEIRKSIVEHFANEKDKAAEQLLEGIGKELEVDNVIDSLMLCFDTLEYIQDLDVKLTDYLLDNYFYDFWDKYTLQVISADSFAELLLEPDYITVNGMEFFNNKIEESGQQIGNSIFYFLDDYNSNVEFIGRKNYFIGKDSLHVQLFISLYKSLGSTDLGYPDLLIDNKYSESDPVTDEYSYGKYRDGKLMSPMGNFPYSINSDIYSRSSNRYIFTSFEDYNHLIYNINEKNTIIISRPIVKVFDYIISFSYIFVFFYILISLVLVIYRFPFHFKALLIDFKKKIQFAMISVLLISFLFVGGGVIYYNIKQYERQNIQSLGERTRSVIIELKDKLEEETVLRPDWNSPKYNNLNALLTKFSNVFFSDINLYSLDGDLLATSRPEIFEKGLIGKKMDSEAFADLAVNEKTRFIHNERIGRMNYISSYVPFNNINNEELAYLNLPYFSKQTSLKKEISTSIVAIINIYVLLILLSIVIAVFISNQLTKPLELIRNKFRKIQLGKLNEVIEYSGKDEIGDLVKEYNKTVTELAENVKLLAKSERESAWREMAKQIAHEIKNPLTPMRLSVQHLERAWKDKVPDWENYLEKVSKTLIEQIDSLSSIASAFSDFAKMPKDNNQAVDVIAKIRNTVLLFRKSKNILINLEFNKYKNIYVWIDKEQFLQVINNLITNAIQSIPEKEKGEIEIEVKCSDNEVLIRISDSGSGIPGKLKEKLFVPNFTTKTSGMGLGLAISKKIIENADGRIWFETEIGKGSTFFIELPLYNIPEE